MNDNRQERESVWSVGRNWLPGCFGLIFALTLAWTWLVAWAEVRRGEHEDIAEVVIAVVSKSASAVPLIVVYAILIVTTLDFIGGAAMVTYRYLERKFLKPQQEKLQAEARAKGRVEGRAEGAEQNQRAWEDWNRRREEAHAREEPFDELPPGC